MMLFAVRYLLPAAIVIAGIALVVASPSVDTLEGASYMIGAGLAVWLMNALYRVSAGDYDDRAAEEAAREYFDRHGRWPDDE